MFKKLRIRTKILLAFAVIAIITVATIVVVAYSLAQSTLEQESYNKLTAVREMKTNQIEDYFGLISDQLITQSQDRMIIDAMKDFEDGYQAIDSDLNLSVGEIMDLNPALVNYYQDEFLERLIPNLLREATVDDYLPQERNTRLLQDLYISSNPFDTGSKHLLNTPKDGSSYSEAHELYHPIVRDFLEHFGYYDIFLVDLEGNIVYSVFKEVDFGTSLSDGPYSETNFAKAFQAALGSFEEEAVIVADFEPYHPSYDAPAAFMASPIYEDGEKLGVLMFQLPIDRINDIMTNDENWAEVGLGESGETYLVGPDFLLRNQSRFLIEDSENYFIAIDESGVPLTTLGRIRNLGSTVGLQEVDTEGTRTALAGETGTAIFPDYRGVPVLSSYKPLNIPGLDWVIMSEIDEAEAFAAIQELGLRLALAAVGLIAFIIVAAVFFSRSLTNPIVQLQAQAGRITAGDLDTKISVDTEDEISDLANALDTMRVSNVALIGDLADINANLEKLVEERTARLEASERQSTSIIEQASDAIVVIDGEGKVLVWNARAEQMFGLSRQEMTGQSPQRIVPEIYIDRHETAMKQAADFGHLTKPGITHELSGLRLDGSEFPIELSLSHWELSGNSFFSASIRDITERKVAEQALRDREERIRSIVEIAPDAIISIDEDQNIIMFNSRAEKTFGYSSAEVMGRPLTMLMPEESQLVHPQEVQKFQDEPAITRTMDKRREIFGRRKDGTIFPAEAGISKLELDGKVIFTTFFRDITIRKQLEADIADQLAFVRTLVDTIPNPIFAMGADQRYVLFNKAHSEDYGIDGETLIGSTVMDIEHIPLEQREIYYAQNSALLESGGLNFDEIEILYADGELHTIWQWVTSFELSDGSIGGIVGIMADITKQKELERQLEIANERMSTELSFARDIQMSMLPLIFPAFPNRKEVTVYATLYSAREVGGDFYDFYFLDDDHLCFVIGDVAGKGAPGALMMAVSKTLIKSRASDDDEPASILTHVNDELSRDNQSSMFVTVFLGIINVKTGEFSYTNAGHNPPYIKRLDGSIQQVDAFHGPVIGAMPGMPYGQDSDRLEAGEVILIYTDGVTEAFNEDEDLFSEDRLEKLLKKKELISAEGITKGTMKALRKFQGAAEQSDDITILAIQYLGLEEASESFGLNLTIKNRYEDMGQVDERFSQFAEDNDLPDAVRQSVSIVLDEMLNNIITYAYQGEKEKEIEVGIELAGNRLVITLKDGGVPFNPFGQETPDTSESIEEREIGGLGIHLVRSMMDEYNYQRQISKNVVTLVKLLGDEDGNSIENQ